MHGFVVNDPSMITAGYGADVGLVRQSGPEIAKAAQDVFNRPALSMNQRMARFSVLDDLVE